jgi:hypothetical protein
MALVFFLVCKTYCGIRTLFIEGRVGNFHQKIIPLKMELTKQMVCSDGNPAFPWNRNLTEFFSRPFHGRKKYSELRIVEQK